MITKRYVLLAALLLLSFPALTGTIIGVLYFIHEKTVIAQRVQSYMFEHESDQRMNWFSVPGAPAIHDTPLPPFHLAKVRTSNWLRKLNLTKPDEDVDINAPIDRSASLENISRDIQDKSVPRSNWIYVSHFPGPDYDPWDKAFDQLLQYHYRTPPANHASISYVDCLSSAFLCGIWGAEAPAMVYLETLTDKCVRTQTAWKFLRTPVMCPVQAKVVQLPFDEEDFYARRPGIFPSEYEQLLSLTEGYQTLEDYSVYTSEERVARDFDKWLLKQSKKIWVLDSIFAIRRPLSENGWLSQTFLTCEAVFLVIAKLSSHIVEWTITLVWELILLGKDIAVIAWELSLRYLGYPGYGPQECTPSPVQDEMSPGAALGADAMNKFFEADSFPGADMGSNFMEYMMAGFIESLGDKIPEDSLDDVMQKMHDVLDGKTTEDTIG